MQSQQRYVNELESAKRTFEAQLHQEHESQKNLVVNLQGQVQFHMSRANSLQATIGNFLYNFCNFAIPVATCAKDCCTLVAILAHYSKSQIFVQKFNFDKTPRFSRVFHQIFLTIFLVKSMLSTAKKVQNHNIFTSFSPPKKSTIFSGNQS